MADQDKHNKTTEEKEDMETTVNGALLKELFESIDITIDRTNDAKTDITSLQSDVTTNNAKVGITTAQASAITANTAKTGITTTQATSITNSENSITTLNMGRVTNVITNVRNVTAQIRHTINIDARTGATTLIKTVILSNGKTFTSSETLTAQKS